MQILYLCPKKRSSESIVVLYIRIYLFLWYIRAIANSVRGSGIMYTWKTCCDANFHQLETGPKTRYFQLP